MYTGTHRETSHAAALPAAPSAHGSVRVHVSPDGRDRRVLCAGHLDLACGPRLARAMRADRGVARITLDFLGAPRVEDSILALAAILARRARALGLEVEVTHLEQGGLERWPSLQARPARITARRARAPRMASTWMLMLNR